MGVDGQARFLRIAADLPDLITREVKKGVRDGFRGPVKKFKTNVDMEIRDVMPKSGGYMGLFSRAWKIRQSGTGLDLKLKGTAAGKVKIRDSKARDEGSLRHPIYGHRRSPWVDQRIKPGFWTRPSRALADDLHEEIEKAMEDVAKRVEEQL